MKRRVPNFDYEEFDQDDYYDGKDMDANEEEIREAEYNRYMRKDPASVTGRDWTRVSE